MKLLYSFQYIRTKTELNFPFFLSVLKIRFLRGHCRNYKLHYFAMQMMMMSPKLDCMIAQQYPVGI